jgi:exonuclease SbcC
VITQVFVENFQSLRKVNLRLGKLTVVVGPSSSGKSALIRAIKLLTSNASGSGFVSHGAKKARVIGVLDSEHPVTHSAYQVEITKGPKVSEYRIVNDTFTKCGTGVPEQVTKLLGIVPKSSINFAGQFDRPFLLDDTGTAVAHELGELTNVSIILDAAREGNRRKGEVSGLVKAKEADLAQLVEQVKEFAGLLGRQAAIKEAEQLVNQAQDVADTSVRLTDTVADLRIAHGVVERLSVLPVPIDLTEVDAVEEKLSVMVYAVDVVQRAEAVLEQRAVAVEAAVEDEMKAQEEFNKMLKDAGTCPLCGQAVH